MLKLLKKNIGGMLYCLDVRCFKKELGEWKA
jgi:hypothetical protein